MNNKRIGRLVASVVVVIGVVALMSGCALSEKGDNAEKMSMDQLPPTVKAAVEKETMDCRVIEVEKELKDGKVIYAVTYDEKGKKMEIEYSEDGTLLFKGLE
jgi:ABC-type uncharacterized transport system auxiliary subunit